MTTVDDTPPPIIQIGPSNQTLSQGAVAILPCKATGNPIPRVTWYRYGTPIQNGHRYTLAKAGSLRINGIVTYIFCSFLRPYFMIFISSPL